MSEENVRAACPGAVVVLMSGPDEIVPHGVLDLTTGETFAAWAHNSDTAFACEDVELVASVPPEDAAWVVVSGFSGEARRGCFSLPQVPA